jgi:hypothetical protein
MVVMSLKQRWGELERMPPVRTGFFVLGCLLIAAAPVVGLVPGPGGIIVFGFGLGLVLKYSDWAKRKYVEFKRRHPNKGAWADWGLRRRSALRRQAREREEQAQGEGREPTQSD